MKKGIHYDIIGDIHGRFDKLQSLMEKLGYRRDADAFTPPAGHMALFLGDLIDTKPGHGSTGGIRATLHAVKAMCDRGDALCLMGNHEFNAICYHTPDGDGGWLRKRSDKNAAQHAGTLADFKDWNDPNGEWLRVWMPWMKSLPLWFDHGSFRLIHACWHPNHLQVLAGRDLDDADFLRRCADKHSREGQAIEVLLKGVEVPLPEPHTFLDSNRIARDMIRARWWEDPRQTPSCRDLVFPPNATIPDAPADPATFPLFAPYDPAAPPVFFGHYFKPGGSPLEPERPNVACLDHSAAKDGPLVAYRWQGETSLRAEHYVTHA